MSALAIARVELVRFLRERSNVFFVFLLPLILVLLIGAQFGGGAVTRVGVVAPDGDGAARDLVAAIDGGDGVEMIAVDGRDALVEDVSRALLAAGVVVPDGYDAALAEARPVTVGFVARPDTTALSLRALVEAAVGDQAAVAGAARAASAETGRPVADLLPLAAQAGSSVAEIEVVTEAVGADELAREFQGLGQFDLGASSQLFLFVFLTSLAGGTALIRTRRLGIARRMLATPTPASAILVGHAAGRFLVALTQAVYIVAATWILFRVNWGDPLATGAVVVAFSLVSAGAGMLVGSVLSNDSQAAGVGVGLGLILAALGGSMAPLEVFPDAMRTVALVTPHAWANTAMAEIVRRDGGVAGVLPQLGALAAYALVLWALAAWALRRALTR